MSGLDVEAVLRQHSYELEHRRGSICLCGFIPTVDPATLATQQDYHRAHVAAVLRVEIESALADVLRDAADEWPEDGMTRSEAQRFLAQRADQIAPYRPTLATTEGDRQ